MTSEVREAGRRKWRGGGVSSVVRGREDGLVRWREDWQRRGEGGQRQQVGVRVREREAVGLENE